MLMPSGSNSAGAKMIEPALCLNRFTYSGTGAKTLCAFLLK